MITIILVKIYENITAGGYVTFLVTVMLILERAVDGTPSQIPTLKFLAPPAPTSPTPGHDPGNKMKILFNMFSIFYL